MRHMTSQLTLITLGILTLSACGATTNATYDAPTAQSAATGVAFSAEATDLQQLAADYKRKPDDAMRAVRYSSALRDAQYYNRAAIILQPFAENPESPLEAKNEYAAVQLELGNYLQAENTSRQVIAQDSENAQSHHHLAIALDAQGRHEKAEEHFRTALRTWQGDPAPVMNNLALNLASQEKLKDAEQVLKDAQAISPNREEIERNLRIIRALKETKS